MGEVPAVELVTVGQRKGLGLDRAVAPARYVVDVDVAARQVTVGVREDLLVAEQRALGWRWVDAAIDGVFDGPVLVQVSAHGQPRPATLVPAEDGVVTVRWHQPERRVAPGQSVVAYDPTDAFVLGGGVAA